MFMNEKITPQTYYQFKEFKTVEGEDHPRLLTPWADPMEYEYPFDFIFNSPEEAYNYVVEMEIEDEAKDWILVKVEDTPVITFTENGKAEDCFEQLQRHISDNFPSGETWVAPGTERKGRKFPRKFTLDTQDPAILHSQYDVEAEKNWFLTAFAEEIEILKQIYKVQVDWAYVVDGS